MPNPDPEEFREDFVRVARNRGPGVTLEQVAADFAVHAMTLSKWMRRADIGGGVKQGTSTQENAELRAAHQRIKPHRRTYEVPPGRERPGQRCSPAGERCRVRSAHRSRVGVPVAKICSSA